MGGSVSTKCTKSREQGESLNSSQYELTEREKMLVRTTWTEIESQKKEVSIEIFLRIFEQIPHAKQLFPFRNEVDESLLKHPYFKGHAMRFINAIGMTIVNLDAWEVILVPSLLRLGQQHASIPDFKQEYFLTFHQAMNDTLSKYLGRAYTAETKAAWFKICRLITSTVERGYIEGQAIKLRQICKTKEEESKKPRLNTLITANNSQMDSVDGNCAANKDNRNSSTQIATVSNTPALNGMTNGNTTETVTSSGTQLTTMTSSDTPRTTMTSSDTPRTTMTSSGTPGTPITLSSNEAIRDLLNENN